MSYVWIRSASPSLFMSHYSKDLLPVAMGSMTVSLIFFLWLYNNFLTRFGPGTTFHIMNIGFVSLFYLHYYLLNQGIAWSSFTLFIIKDIYIMILLEQVWSYFNTVNSVRSARLLSGPLMAVVSIFSISAGKFLSSYASEIGSVNTIALGATVLLPCSLFMHWGLKKVKLNIEPRDEPNERMGLGPLKKNPALFALFFVIFTSQILATATTLRLQSAVSDFIPLVDEQTAYFANYYANIDSVAMVFQFLITPLALSFVPLSFIHILIPFLHCILGVWVLQSSDLNRIMLTSLIFKSIDYSLYKGAKEMIYVPLSDEVRYRTKQIIDVFGYRFGKGSISMFFGALKSGFKVADVTYSYVALGAGVIWLGLGFVIGRNLKRQ